MERERGLGPCPFAAHYATFPEPTSFWALPSFNALGSSREGPLIFVVPWGLPL